MKQIRNTNSDGARPEGSKTAFLVIDMQKAFVEPGAALRIAGAKATVPAIRRALDAARRAGARIWWVEREYAADGSDMEKPRRKALESLGISGVLAPGSTGLNSVEQPDGLRKEPGDRTIIKKRYSAFFGTDLDRQLREEGIETIVLLGTTTPNCIRSTCYDGISLNYDVVVLEPCCSSNTPEIQRSNMEDMERAGAVIIRLSDLSTVL
ncbi:Nicotinamidase-related amidase [Eubacterium pyruvativorans]|uniref:Nicotinamidase-related amidase n=1 Tax=Eubacterium pyruvativorans TaxID=155865 RepID=A0A1I7FNY6_9FIRM|nr:cysteine hydrolase [Eubacterium pyruvativorans]SFN94957.1 Nicotinamidase-related amidase [Eubacterium pyruvativorans]SFU37880.1 Nicotinamidase-related amidase [Eubacterium pyruvativorans]